MWEMKNLKTTVFLSWACDQYLKKEEFRAVFMKFKFGEGKDSKELSFIGLRDDSWGIIYGWSKACPPSWDFAEVYYCCHAPIDSIESEEYLGNILLKEIDEKLDFFPSPNELATSKTLKYDIVALGEGAHAIKLS
ncbi:hypothetical protein CVU82_00810 [Candidatus Falkowbacteria bacterium HGW-Falkowbacteria-1]|jgi:hypothetical protein|uniref:Uncharacterized protein n=1 Tax=Candidatus Falkowbacteria bacterium HGW-Falkowbacteria-1 TaxID=2013768 RepID=A0A2N2EAI5_9BACT|nr:MAG: hypothetical protein CVU82_00810 [Candidatus Falkowbacteria bacterium HGW-Falkowbacteria-1]